MPERDWIILGDCSKGHTWVQDGGRPCPLVDQETACPARNLFCSRLGLPSQPVYRCSACPEIDYGGRGGPGHQFCAEECMPHA